MKFESICFEVKVGIQSKLIDELEYKTTYYLRWHIREKLYQNQDGITWIRIPTEIRAILEEINL